MGEHQHRRKNAYQLLDMLLARFERLVGHIDKKSAELVAAGEREEGKKVPCAGCQDPACCRQIVLVTVSEGLWLARHVRKEGMDSPAFRDRLRKQGDHQWQLGRDDYFDLQIDCPLLLANGQCVFYSHRPMVCRTYWVWTPREMCRPVGGPGVENPIRMTDNGPIMEATVLGSAALLELLQLHPPALEVLPTMLELSLRAYDQPERADEIFQNHYWPGLDQLHAGKR